MKIVLFTSQDVGPRLVEFFSNISEVDLVVITQQTYRDRIYGYSSTEEVCTKLSVKCIKPVRLDEDFIESIRTFNPDIIFSVYYPKIFPKRLIEIPRLGAVNVHPGDLPYYRGRFAIPWAILNGETEITVSMHYIDDKVDSGDVIVKSKFEILPQETGFQLYLRAMHKAADLVISTFESLINGELKRIPQLGYGTYYSYLDNRYHINWQSDGMAIQRNVRVHARPYLPAFGYLTNHCVYINQVSFSQPLHMSASSIGVIVDVESNGNFSVSCSNGVVRIEEFDFYPSISNSDFANYVHLGAKFE